MIEACMRGQASAPLVSLTIGAAFDKTVRRHGEACALVSRHQRLRYTYRELAAAVDALTLGLQALGIGRAERVALWSPNCAEWLITQYAVARLGAILVHVNPACGADELATALQQSEASLLITARRAIGVDSLAVAAAVVERVRSSAAPHPPALRHSIALASEPVDGFISWAELAAGRHRGPTRDGGTAKQISGGPRPDEPASIMYTSGTTGTPRGATLSHASLVANAWLIAERLSYRAGERVCLPVPLFHTLGNVVGAMAAMTHGCAVVLPGPVFDPCACVEAVRDESCTALFGVPSMFAAILEHPKFDPSDVQSLRTGVMAGAPCPEPLMRDVMTRLHMPEATICYGMTEIGTVCQSRPDDRIDDRTQTVGAIHPHVELRVVDPGRDSTVACGEEGELWARGYCTMSGYWRDPSATREAMSEDGWIRTGDIAVMRADGYVRIVGRLKDVVIVAGENVHPREIEDVMRAHASVREASVVGASDPLHGEVLWAWVQLHERRVLSADELRRYCRERLPAHKTPRHIRFLDAFPTTASGKIQKFRLRQMAAVERVGPGRVASASPSPRIARILPDRDLSRHPMSRHRYLGVLLCYNDGDILEDAIRALLEANHHVVVWNHGSTDETANVLRHWRRELVEVTDIGREVDFYDMYPLMSKHLLANYVSRYDWLSWPDQDEILEGPSRCRSYREWLDEAVESRHAWIEFNDFVYWYTSADDHSIPSPLTRIRHYALAHHGSPKIRSWRASATNIRWFNHNRANGSKYPELFNLRHYPMRSAQQLQRRLSGDRAGLQRGPVNYHYENMKETLAAARISADDLHHDSGRGELNHEMKFDWKTIYGSGPRLPREVVESFLLPTKRWEIAAVIRASLERVPAQAQATYGVERLMRWQHALDQRIPCPVVVALKKADVKIVSEELSRTWTPGAEPPDNAAMLARSCEATLGALPVVVFADAEARSIRVAVNGSEAHGTAPLIALVPCYGDEPPYLASVDAGRAEFHDLPGLYYYITAEPQSA